MSTLTESEKRAARAALEALRDVASTAAEAVWCAQAIAHLDAQPTADEPTPAAGFTAWVTRDANGHADLWTHATPEYNVHDGMWVSGVLDAYGESIGTVAADALLGDARGEKAIRRVRIVPDGEVGDE